MIEIIITVLFFVPILLMAFWPLIAELIENLEARKNK